MPVVLLDRIVRLAETDMMMSGLSGLRLHERDVLPPTEEHWRGARTRRNVTKGTFLFIASGMFRTSKPSDMLPELQGRAADPGQSFKSAHPRRSRATSWSSPKPV